MKLEYEVAEAKRFTFDKILFNLYTNFETSITIIFRNKEDRKKFLNILMKTNDGYIHTKEHDSYRPITMFFTDNDNPFYHIDSEYIQVSDEEFICIRRGGF